jgi:pimeloyl-ACP methyl ester carboxylesterase
MSSDSEGESPLAYEWHGPGDPLELSAGPGGKGTSWRPFLARAAERHRVLITERCGSGRADAIDGGTTIRALAADVLEVIPGAGHLPYLEAPDRFAERVLAFLDPGTSRGEVACRRPTP